MTDLNYKAILTEALAAPAPHKGLNGCGRIYVSFPAEHAKGVAKAAKALGKIFQKKSHYGASNALYVGYDNASGVEASRGETIAKVFADHGVSAYVDYCGD